MNIDHIPSALTWSNERHQRGIFIEISSSIGWISVIHEELVNTVGILSWSQLKYFNEIGDELHIYRYVNRPGTSIKVVDLLDVKKRKKWMDLIFCWEYQTFTLQLFFEAIYFGLIIFGIELRVNHWQAEEYPNLIDVEYYNSQTSILKFKIFELKVLTLTLIFGVDCELITVTKSLHFVAMHCGAHFIEFYQKKLLAKSNQLWETYKANVYLPNKGWIWNMFYGRSPSSSQVKISIWLKNCLKIIYIVLQDPTSWSFARGQSDDDHIFSID